MGHAWIAGAVLSAAGCAVYGAPGDGLRNFGGTTAQGGQPPIEAGLGGTGSVGGSSCNDAVPDDPEPFSCSGTAITCGDICVSPLNPAFGCGDPACVSCGYPLTNVSCGSAGCVLDGCEPELADCDADPGNGCEVDTRSDALHCGACDRDCGGTACFLGICEATTLADAGGEIEDITVDEETVYFAHDASTISTVPKSGGAPSILATGLEEPRALAVDEQFLYFATKTDVMKADKAGGQPIVLASQQDAMGELAIDTDFVYWTTYHDCGAVKRVPKNGTQSVTLAEDAALPWSLVVDGAFVYWSTFNGFSIRKLDKSGAGVAVSIAPGQSSAYSLTVDDELLFFVSPASGVTALPKTGGTPLTHSENSNQISNIAVDSDFVYWLVAGRVGRSPKSGGAMSERAWWAATTHTGKGLAVDTAYVYFADGGRVLRAAK